MKYILSFVFLLSLLPFLSVDARSDDLHPTLQERKIENFDVRSAIPTLEPANPAIQGSEARNPRDEQTPRDRQAVLCDPKFGGDPSDPGCQKPNPPTPPPAPGPTTPPQGGPGPQETPSPATSENPPTTSGEGQGGVIGLSKTSAGGGLPLVNFLGLACLTKGLILVKKSLLK